MYGTVLYASMYVCVYYAYCIIRGFVSILYHLELIALKYLYRIIISLYLYCNSNRRMALYCSSRTKAAVAYYGRFRLETAR
jgi:hypothetical protein